MKKNYLNILIALVFSLSGFSQTKHIAVNIDIRGRDCSGGIGLCNISKSLNSTDTNAIIYIASTGELVLEVNYFKISSTEIINLLGEPYKTTKSNYTFAMLYDLALNEEIQNILDLSKSNGKIPKGFYPAAVAKGTMIIKIPLAEDL